MQVTSTAGAVLPWSNLQVWESEKEDFDNLTEQTVHKSKMFETMNAVVHFW